MCSSTKYIDGVSVSANCQNICAVSVSVNEKIISAVSVNFASIVEKDFNIGRNIFIKIIITKKLAAIALF